MAHAFVTIGTADSWAPPKYRRFELTDEFVIVNAETVAWRIEGEGVLTRAAVRAGGLWWGVPIAPYRVGRGQMATIAEGALRIIVHGNPLPNEPDWGDVELVTGSGLRWLPDGTLG
jgi:hypothetical protein